MVQMLWKTVCLFLKKSNTEFPYDPAIPFLYINIFPREMKTHSNKKIIHKSSFFIIAKSWWKDPNVHQLMNE